MNIIKRIISKRLIREEDLKKGLLLEIAAVEREREDGIKVGDKIVVTRVNEICNIDCNDCFSKMKKGFRFDSLTRKDKDNICSCYYEFYVILKDNKPIYIKKASEEDECN